MKKLLMAAVALVCVGSTAFAGPNAGGTLILHANPGLVYTTDVSNYCGQSGLQDCDAAINTVGGELPTIAFAIAAFAPSASPSLAGVAFGINYPASITLVAQASCGDFELSTDTWPDSGSGTAVTFSTARHTQLVEVYWFAAYDYYGAADPGSICLGPHPTQGGVFADDAVPSNLDAITGFGCLGFFQPGSTPCPHIVLPTGACCLPNFGPCVVVTADECASAQGSYQGDGTLCEPNPCPSAPLTGACCVGTVCIVTTQADCDAQGGSYNGDNTPCTDTLCQTPVAVESKTWGGVKKTYR